MIPTSFVAFYISPSLTTFINVKNQIKMAQYCQPSRIETKNMTKNEGKR